MVKKGVKTVREKKMDDEPIPPSSPTVSPVQLEGCIVDLLKFTLSSSIDETLEIDLGLSKEYCSDLLRDDLGDPNFDATDSVGGVQPYPLYKCLASALHQCITSGAIQRTYNEMASIQEDDSLKQKEDEWSKLLLDRGSELINMLKAVEFELHVQEPFFSQLRAGLKTIEGRCAVGAYNQIGPGALLLFNKCLLLEVQDVKWYASFSEMLEVESLAKVLPGVNAIKEVKAEEDLKIPSSRNLGFQLRLHITSGQYVSLHVAACPTLLAKGPNNTVHYLAKGVQIYRKFYTEEKERSNGVLAIWISRLAAQPYISLGCIISGLSYEGVRSLLGLAQYCRNSSRCISST